MKILLAIALAALPVAVSAQAVTGTLDMVQNLSVSAVSNTDLAKAREDAGKPFSMVVNAPQPVHSSGPKPPPPRVMSGTMGITATLRVITLPAAIILPAVITLPIIRSLR